MDFQRPLLLLALYAILLQSKAQHENIPYENVADICASCVCSTAHDADKHYHHFLDCGVKKFKHILARWPEEFGKNHYSVDIVATFSGNTIELLQQLPATNATLTFSCRHCGIKYLQAPTFMDVPYIRNLDLSWNEITSDELTSDVFRGPYRSTHYEPIGLVNLDISHNKLHTLDRKIFEHTPNLTKLNLSYNELTLLSPPTVLALSSAIELEELDLSHTSIKALSETIFKSLVNLRKLNLAGNELVVVPDKMQLIGKSLVSLNLAENPVVRFTEDSFIGLKSLERLNISSMPLLEAIDKNTFTRLETLQRLDCAFNHKLVQFDMESLMHSSNLTHLDISYCALTTIFLPVDISNEPSAKTSTISKPWPYLHTLVMVGNPWCCDCGFMQTLQYIDVPHEKDTETHCDTPYYLAGSRISNFTAQQICNLKIPKKYKAIDEEPPRFLRKRYIILTAITATVVVSVGVMLGFAIACIRRRLKRNDFGVEPIRYTSVRSSNLSAFSHGNTNSLAVNGNAAASA